uniref:YafQ toxin protein n=1 Tax=uncultured Thiotrichaceae bacterium TaxID=298394 RepID=A0A6S6UH25_9GAMM|nr:MAG: YafQ toxin protein [uncultured Thiotrichaceae bacterium]
MRVIERTNAFKRDFKKHGELEAALIEVLWKLGNDEPLPERFKDHALTGNWVDFRDCHIKPDLVLIYRKPDEETLQLVRMGSHSELDL